MRRPAIVSKPAVPPPALAPILAQQRLLFLANVREIARLRAPLIGAPAQPRKPIRKHVGEGAQTHGAEADRKMLKDLIAMGPAQILLDSVEKACEASIQHDMDEVMEHVAPEIGEAIDELEECLEHAFEGVIDLLRHP